MTSQWNISSSAHWSLPCALAHNPVDREWSQRVEWQQQFISEKSFCSFFTNISTMSMSIDWLANVCAPNYCRSLSGVFVMWSCHVIFYLSCTCTNKQVIACSHRQQTPKCLFCSPSFSRCLVKPCWTGYGPRMCWRLCRYGVISHRKTVCCAFECSKIWSNSTMRERTSSRWSCPVFDGDEKNCELWETKFLGHLWLQILKDTILDGPAEGANARALVMWEAADVHRESAIVSIAINRLSIAAYSFQ